jgi:protein ImuB
MAGPWRSSGDWWDQDGWARDEWDIAIPTTVAGLQSSVASHALSLYRLVYDLLSGGWFVEGTYD